MKINSDQCHSDAVHQFLNATGRDKALSLNQFGGITCSKLIVVLWGFLWLCSLTFLRPGTWAEDVGGFELVKFRLSDSHACQSVCIYTDSRIDSSPDLDNYRCGPFYTRAVLSISVIMGCGEGESYTYKEAHLETFPLSICVKPRFLISFTSRREVCRQCAFVVFLQKTKRTLCHLDSYCIRRLGSIQ